MDGFRKVVDGNGMLFANPIPEEFSLPKEMIDAAIDQAVKEAAKQGIYGHANTPFILAKIKELTQGNSLPANRGLIESNVAMAACVATEYSKLLQTTAHLSNHFHKALYRQPISPGGSTSSTSASENKLEIASGRTQRAVSESEGLSTTNGKPKALTKKHSFGTSTTESHSPELVDSQPVRNLIWNILPKKFCRRC